MELRGNTITTNQLDTSGLMDIPQRDTTCNTSSGQQYQGLVGGSLPGFAKDLSHLFNPLGGLINKIDRSCACCCVN